jgi:hypothetical protein
MKFKFILMAMLTAFVLSAQVEEKLKLEVLKSDSSTTYYLTETVRVEGRKVSERVLPEDGTTLTKDEFKTYVGNLIKTQQNRLAEAQLAQKKFELNINFLGSTIDSVCGTGAFAALQNESIKMKLQGIWQIVERNGETKSIPIVIQGNEAIANGKTAAIVWKNSETFQLVKGIFDYNLTFKWIEPDKYLAERTSTVGGQSVITKYTLRR